MKCYPYGSLEEYIQKGNRWNETELRVVLSYCVTGLVFSFEEKYDSQSKWLRYY